MKKRIHFSKAFLPSVIVSSIIIIAGIVSIFTRGINFSIDFKPGYIEEVEITTSPSIEELRTVLSSVPGVSVKTIGTDAEPVYQIRVADQGKNALEPVDKALAEKYSTNFTVLKTDYIGSSLSKTFAMQSILLLIGTMICIWIYASIRFRWDFALGSIIALLHDSLIIFAFFSFFQVEFSTTSIAAVLTIIGYSINATVVILDRVRENVQKLEVKKFSEVLNQSLSDTLSRSIITTITTLFAVVSLYVFTTGSIHDFAWALIIGLLSGCYSSILISSAFIALVRKNWKPSYGLHVSAKSLSKAN